MSPQLRNVQSDNTRLADQCPPDGLYGIQQATQFDLGSFEGFNFRDQSAIDHNLTADEVIGWDHDGNGEAEFWPAGDRPEVAWLFSEKSAVTASELQALDALLDDLGGDEPENFLKIHDALNVGSGDLRALTAQQVEDENVYIYFGSNFSDLRRAVAYELFELYHPEAYAVWEKSLCDGLIFDTDRFLDSVSFSVEEVRLGDKVALIVSPQ